MDTAVVAVNTAPLATGEPVFRFYDNRQKYLLFGAGQASQLFNLGLFHACNMARRAPIWNHRPFGREPHIERIRSR